MRKLGKGQSVVFCVPREIEQKIKEQQGPVSEHERAITVSDVIYWVITETFVDLRRSVPLWFAQGIRFHKQEVWGNEPNEPDSEPARRQWASQFLEDEAQTLDQRYRPHSTCSSLLESIRCVGSDVGEELKRRCEEFGFKQLPTGSLQEEQERELSPETERERQAERPPIVRPRIHRICPGLRYFIRHGRLQTMSNGCMPAFFAFQDTSMAEHFDIYQFQSHIYVTSDFCNTVEKASDVGSHSDLFQRSVQWILTSSHDMKVVSTLIIISAYEAQELMPDIEKSKNVTLHLYSPRTNHGFPSLDHLQLHTVPPRTNKLTIPKDMSVYLNLFAGQLYLSSFQEYGDICDRLGVAWEKTDESVVIGPDGFISPDLGRGGEVNRSGFQNSPVPFLKGLLCTTRQNGQSIEKTHVGKILDGVLLEAKDFEGESNGIE